MKVSFKVPKCLGVDGRFSADYRFRRLLRFYITGALFRDVCYKSSPTARILPLLGCGTEDPIFELTTLQYAPRRGLRECWETLFRLSPVSVLSTRTRIYLNPWNIQKPLNFATSKETSTSTSLLYFFDPRNVTSLRVTNNSAIVPLWFLSERSIDIFCSRRYTSARLSAKPSFSPFCLWTHTLCSSVNPTDPEDGIRFLPSF